MEKTKKNGKTDKKEISKQTKTLILYNDDYNTFDYVIETLIKVCKHDPIQAEQCAVIAHYKGKAKIKSGDYEELKPLRDAIITRGLNVTIE